VIILDKREDQFLEASARSRKEGRFSSGGKDVEVEE
jgi:hypothetical protein